LPRARESAGLPPQPEALHGGGYAHLQAANFALGCQLFLLARAGHAAVVGLQGVEEVDG